jgi:hypothetical protein
VGKAVSLEKKIGIEPLGEARWARVERAVLNSIADDEFATPALAEARPSPWWRWRSATPLVLTGAVAAVFGAVALRALGQPDAPLGPTRIATAGNGSRVEVGESTVEVGPQSAVRLAGDDAHGISVQLDTGRVECDVAPRRGRPPFLVEAGAVEVRVIGTHFVVTRAGDAVTVDVQRGRVEVLSGQEHAFVDAGTQWPLRGSQPLPVTPPTVAAASESATSPVAEALPADNQPRAAVESRSPGSVPAAGRATPRERYEAASKLEAQKPDTAISLYSELSRQGGAWGMNALFAEGRLEADRGRQSDATRLLGEYLARYPFGPNAEDARRLLARMR